MNEQPLEDALRAAQAGQAWAARVLYEALAPRVVGYLRARGAAEPEDLTSEVFLTVFTRLGTLTGGMQGLRTFVFSVAHARLVDELRQRSRRPAGTSYDAVEDPRTSPSAEELGITRVQTERVRELLGSLVPDQRDVLVLRVLGDLTVEQVAEVLGKSPGAVKQLQRRGLLALRRRIEKAQAGPSGGGEGDLISAEDGPLSRTMVLERGQGSADHASTRPGDVAPAHPGPGDVAPVDADAGDSKGVTL